MSTHLDPDWLRAKYVDEGLSTYDIGRLVSRDPKRIYEKLREFGIPTRPRGENLRGADCYMKSGGVNPFAGRKHTAEARRAIGSAAAGAKPNLRGARNGMAGRTGAANPNYRDGSSPERQRAYASGVGRDFLRAIYARDSYRCRRCGAGKKGPRGIHAHHIRPWAGNPALRFDAENVVTLCRACHEWVHSAENVAREFVA